MMRAENVFFNLVTNENSTTELLCNFMKYASFRNAFIAMLFGPGFISDSAPFEAFSTQVDLDECGQPDMMIETGDFVALIEVKAEAHQGLTVNQPEGYLRHLKGRSETAKWLVFLVPKEWKFLPDLKRNKEFAAGLASEPDRIRTRVLYWDQVITLLNQSENEAERPFLQELRALLRMRFEVEPVKLTMEEISMVYSTAFPSALKNLQQLVDNVAKLGSSVAKIRSSRSRSLFPEDYGIYLLNEIGKEAFWFGVWGDYWLKSGRPLCFGVKEGWGSEVHQAFTRTYPEAKPFNYGYTIGWIEPEVIDQSDSAARVWEVIAPGATATVEASNARIALR
jgi:hypothetical protein